MAVMVEVRWVANPFRGDEFADGWRAAAEAALDYGAKSWGFYRNADGRLDFVQTAVFESKADFELYWYSETVAEARLALSGHYQVPVQPVIYEIVGDGQAAATNPTAG